MSSRIDRLRRLMDELHVDAAVISSPANRRYFSGFPGDDHAPDSSSGVLCVSQQDAVLYTSPTNLPWAAATVISPVTAQPWERPWPDFLGRRLHELGVRNAAIEDRVMAVADYHGLERAGVSLKPAGNAVNLVRAVKDDHELAAIRKAAQITDAAFAAAMQDLRAGSTERALAWRIESAMRSLGAEGLAFPISVASGPHSARPHHDPTDRPLGDGEPIVIDLGAQVDGYCGDLTRTVVIGEIPPIFLDRYNRVLEAQRVAIAGARAGMTGREVDALARDSLAADGLGDQFVHGLGHGVGLVIHEYPSLGKASDDILQPGHVVTIEPGIYLEDWGGIRIEDLCVVTTTGLEVLSGAPRTGVSTIHDRHG